MNKLKMQSLDGVASNVEKIAQLFPHCVTEHLNKDGKPELAIDFEKLQAELSNDIIAEGEERYQFTWPDKRAAIRLANTPTTMTLRPCREDSVDFDNTKNLYIEGDNLDVLKVLRETYLGKVKVIYIDPPYNTGNDFVYNDDFVKSKGKFEQTSGLFDEDGNQTITPMQRNTESNGRFHTDWLNMMYPRLILARSLMADDGFIFISIDDNEIETMKMMLDEIFGNNLFINMFIWQRNSSGKTEKDKFTVNTEYVLLYAKSMNYKLNSVYKPLADSSIMMYNKDDNDGRGKYATVSLQKPRDPGPETTYDYVDNNGKIWKCPKKGWRMTYDKVKALENDGRLFFSGKTLRVKDYWNERESTGKRIDTLWNDLPENNVGSAELEKAIGAPNVFNNPKPTDLIRRCIEIAGIKDVLVLDFFSGSATAAHAVMQLNAEDGGDRQYIMVQLPELCEEKSEAYRAGYKNICEIGKKRIQRAGQKIKDEAGLQGQNLDIGFRVLKLDSSNMEDVYYTPQEFGQQALFNENVKPDRSNEDLLFQVMLDLGIELSAKIAARQIAGKTVHFVDNNYLVACFDNNVNETTIMEIAKQHPIYFVMRDASAANDNVIDNFEQIFKHFSPDTTCKII